MSPGWIFHCPYLIKSAGLFLDIREATRLFALTPNLPPSSCQSTLCLKPAREKLGLLDDGKKSSSELFWSKLKARLLIENMLHLWRLNNSGTVKFPFYTFPRGLIEFLFRTQLPSGKRVQSLRGKTSRVCNSTYPATIRLLNAFFPPIKRQLGRWASYVIGVCPNTV